MGTPGLSFGDQERMMGFRGVPSADIFLDGVRVQKANLLAGPGDFARLMQLFNIERLGNATMALGVAAGALERVTAYVQERRQFGKPLVDFQAVQLRLGDMACKVEAARLRSEEHTSELQSLMRISYAVFCLKKKKTTNA